VRYAAKFREDPMLRIQDIMTREVLSVSPDLSIRETMELLSTRHLSGAPVVSGSNVVGVVSSSDLMALAAELARLPIDGERELDHPGDDEAPADLDDASSNYFVDLWEREAGLTPASPELLDAAWSALGEHTVGEAMTLAPVQWLPSDGNIEEAAALMCHSGIHRLLVMNDGMLVGIVTTTDIVRAVANYHLAP
jgi:CBS domain-containing protein